MDIKAPGKEVSQELARELLIAISQSLPYKVLDSKFSSDNLKNNNVVKVIDGDGVEKYRSKLISISCLQSSDIKTLPVASKDLED